MVDKEGAYCDKLAMSYPTSENIKLGLIEVERLLMDEFSDGLQEVADIAKHVIAGGGKRLRPIVFLSAAGLAGTNPADVVDIAAAIEMIHTASLLHDDVVDSSNLRRGKPAVRDWWGDKVSILAGDLMWCKASQIFVRHDIDGLVAAATNTVMSMTEGQMLELRHMNDTTLEKNRYWEMIDLKTASLYSFASRAGSIVSGGSEKVSNALEAYGHGIGMAFQLIDDAMDYAVSEMGLGKPCMADLRDGKSTYPFIVAMERIDSNGRNVLRDALQSKKMLGPSSLIDRAKSIVIDSGSVDETYELAIQFADKAKDAIAVFDENEFKRTLIEVADHIVEAGIRE